MLRKASMITLLVAPAAWIVLLAGPSGPKAKPDMSWLWVDPGDMRSRDLKWGLGSAQRAPKRTEYTFIEQDTSGVNPKYLVSDADGVKWKIKIGREAGPEVAATRILWAVGYHTHEDYFVPSLRVSGLPKTIRGRDMVGPDGTLTNARLRRIRTDEKKVGWWKWDESPFASTREFNALRTMMAVLNNWDLKDTNNAVVDNVSASTGRPERMYMASDMGATFGSTSVVWNKQSVKGNAEKYAESKFITSTTADTVSFNVTGNFRFNGAFAQYLTRRPRVWITHDIPRQDAKWLGELLGRLSPGQLRDAFLTAGYDQEEAGAFASALEKRIAALRAL